VPTEVLFPLAGKRVFVAGHAGMVGSAIVRRLAKEACNVVAAARDFLDLTDQTQTLRWFQDTKPDVVIVAAAKVGGILANASYPADFLYQNLMIETNVIEAARLARVSKLIFLGSSCIYPKLAPQPMREEMLLTGPLEPSNEWYAIAKIAGIKLCQAYRKQYACDFISCLPTNLYGPGDDFDLETSHVVPALMRKAHEAKTRGDGALTIWGTGMPLRELLYVDDCADAVVHLLKTYSDEAPINVGSGEEVTVSELARLIASVVGFTGEIRNDPTKPDGTPRKLLNSSRLTSLGWSPKTPLREGLETTYRWFRTRSEQGLT
jgi:GDP-L-fucose synthase